MITRVRVSLQEIKQPSDNFNRIVNKALDLCKAPGDSIDIILKDDKELSEDYDDRLLCHIELNSASIYCITHNKKLLVKLGIKDYKLQDYFLFVKGALMLSHIIDSKISERVRRAILDLCYIIKQENEIL